METEDGVFLVYEHFHTSLRKHLANPEFLNIPNWKKVSQLLLTILFRNLCDSNQT